MAPIDSIRKTETRVLFPGIKVSEAERRPVDGDA
jgi:hypothetical protein